MGITFLGSSTLYVGASNSKFGFGSPAYAKPSLVGRRQEFRNSNFGFTVNHRVDIRDSKVLHPTSL
jgi:hypothetical protein